MRLTRRVFLTWRIHDSLPSHRAFPTAVRNSGQAFAAMDRLLDEVCGGPFYRRQPAVADMIVEAIQYNADVLQHYVLHAFVVMPNHVHLLATPAMPLPKLTKSLKGITSKRANAMLSMTGNSFWQEESYDHLVRHEREFEKIRNYLEETPCGRGWRGKPGSIVGRARDGRRGRRGALWARTRGSAPPTPGSCKYRVR